MKVKIEGLPQKNQINTTIKPIKVKEANAEIEKGEIVFNPNNLLLQLALGKKHSKGGTPVLLDPGTFIFSDFKKMALTKNDKTQMELKKGSKSKTSSTPAKVLKKEIDLNHHNRMADILMNDRGDDISKVSAQLMLQKNVNTLGKIAFKQEEKKYFEDGVPDFAQNTLPVYTDQLDRKLTQADQYKKGGEFRYLPKYQKGKSINNIRDLYDDFVKKYGKFEMPVKGAHYDFNKLPKGYNDPEYAKAYMTIMNAITGYNYPTTQAGWAQMRLNQERDNSEYIQNAIQNGYINRNASSEFKYGDPTRPWYDGIGVEKNPRKFDNVEAADAWKKEVGWKPIPGDMNKGYYVNPETGRYIGAKIDLGKNLPAIPKAVNPTSGIIPGTSEKIPTSVAKEKALPKPEEDPTLGVGKNPKIKFTDLQKLSMADGFMKSYQLKGRPPMRQHQESVVTPNELFSAQPGITAINRNRFNANQGLRGLTNSSQYLAGINSIAGSTLDSEIDHIGQIENNNVSLRNNDKQQAAQTLNIDAAANRNFDKSYAVDYDNMVMNLDNGKDLLKEKAKQNFYDQLNKKAAAQSYYNLQPKVATNKKDKNGKTIYEPAVMPVRGWSGYTNELNPNLTGQSYLNYQTGQNGIGPGINQGDIAQAYLANQQQIKELQSNLGPETTKEQQAYLRNLITQQTTYMKALGMIK